MGNPTPSVLLGAVSLLPSEPSAVTPCSASSGIAVGWSPALASAVFQGAQLGEAARVPGAD